MSKEKWYPSKGEALLPPEPEAIHHHIPFKWGSFQVTDGANEAYALVPLNSDQQLGPPTERSVRDDFFETDVYLQSPEETPTTMPADLPGLWVRSREIETGIQLHLGFSKTTKEIVSEIKNRLDTVPEETDEAYDPLGIIEALQEAKGEVEEMGDERLEAGVRQQLIHGFAEMAGVEAENSSAKWMRIEKNKRFYKQIRKTGAATIALTGSLGGYELALNSGKIDVVQGIGLGVILALSGSLLARNLREYLQRTENDNAEIADMAQLLADTIVSDIHESYCIAHFDRKAEQMLNGHED